jgi:hypothetical protein
LLAVTIAAMLAAVAAPAQAGIQDPGTVITYDTFGGPQLDDDGYVDVAAGGPVGDMLYAAGHADQDYGADAGYLLTTRYLTVDSTPVWTRSWRPYGSLRASAAAVTADNDGNVITVGTTWDGAQYDMVVVKRDQTGAIVWWATRAGAAGMSDVADDVVTDGAGNVYVCGTMDGAARAVVLKYAADPDPNGFQTGLLLWEKATRPTVTPGSTEAWELAYADGALYFTGGRTTKNGSDCFLRKLGRDGSSRWTRSWDGAAHRYDYGQAVEVFRSSGPDAVYVAGGTETRTHGWDVVLLKYTTGGKRLWTRTYDGATHRSDEVWDLDVDGRGRARVVGSSFVADGSVNKAMLVAWSADGSSRWARTYRGAGQQAAFGSVVAGSSAIWVAGHVDTGAQREWVVARYGANGTRAWLARWPGPPGDPRGGSAHTCLTYSSGGLFVAGAVNTAAAGDDAAVVWYQR